MRILFVAYCMIDNENGDSLIGVYKRCLRIGLELADRGHEIWIFCTGRERFHDAATTMAEGRIHFFDIRWEVLLSPSIALRRRFYRWAFRRLKPDLVVAGEVPLAGTLLESTLCAVGLRIPVVILDNAYSPELAELFVKSHGSIADGLVLTGPSLFHMHDPPPYYCAAPPFVEGSGGEADALLAQLGLRAKRLITVLGYERKAELLAAAMLPKLGECEAVFLSRQPNEDGERLAALPEAIRKNVRVLGPPAEPVLFSLLRRSSLVIGKCGFMQVSECLALGTPFIGIQYRGCFSFSLLHRRARKFVHSTTSIEADRETTRVAQRFLKTSPREMASLHNNRFGGTALVADFIERLPRTPRKETTAECERLGYSREMVQAAVERLRGGAIARVHWVRATRLRNVPGGRIDSVTALYEGDGVCRQALLWGRVYHDRAAARRDSEAAAQQDSPRRVLHRSPNGLTVIELDIGEGNLPPLDV
jgi:hypothetical protein